MTREQAIEFLTRLAQAVSVTFGPLCETVVQEPRDGKIVTLAIFNGQVSGRKLPTTEGITGGQISDETVSSLCASTDMVNQLVLHPNGKKIKTTTVSFNGDGYTLLFGINCDVTAVSQFQEILGSYMTFSGELSGTISQRQQSLQSVYDACLAESGLQNCDKFPIAERHSLILLLNSRGFFSMQKSIPFLAEKTGVSRYTLYKDLDELEIR